MVFDQTMVQLLIVFEHQVIVEKGERLGSIICRIVTLDPE